MEDDSFLHWFLAGDSAALLSALALIVALIAALLSSQ